MKNYYNYSFSDLLHTFSNDYNILKNDGYFCRKKQRKMNVKKAFYACWIMSVITLSFNVSHAQVGNNIALGGFIDGQYRFEDSGDNQSSIFQVRRARLDLKGSVSPCIDLRLQADFASSPRLLDAFVKLKFSKYAQLQFGQFKIPFSLENKLSPLELELTDNAQVISALSGYNDVTGIASYTNGREVGAMLCGTVETGFTAVPIISYSIGLFGGNGINVKNDNMAKDVSARIEICPFVKDLVVSGSGYWGKYDMIYNGTATGTDGDRIRYAVGAQYDNKRFLIRSEYLWGKTDFALYDAVLDNYSPEAMNTRGCYVTAGYWFFVGHEEGKQQRIRPLLRYDYYEKDVDDDASIVCYSAGVEWWPERHLRFQLAYTLTNKEDTNLLGHRLTAMASVKF